MRVMWLTTAALIGFAANSLLTRSALAGARIDAATFTGVRLLSGAVTLWLLVAARAARPRRDPPASASGAASINGASLTNGGASWPSAIALAGYAIAFTLAYRRIGAGVGALALFGAVQVTMIGRAIVAGARPSIRDQAGWLLAVAGLATLTLPGATKPDLGGLALMVLAGACWGVYSLRGRRNSDPLRATAGNFLRACLFGAAFVAASTLPRVLSPGGVGLAIASGALASGIGYALWYAALPSLSAWRAAVIQLTVPILTAGSAVLLLGETFTARLAGATVLVVAGVILTVWPASRLVTVPAR